MKNKTWKKFKYQTESNKFYYILAGEDFNKEDGVKLNPFLNSENLMDKEVIIVQQEDLADSPCFNIKNTDTGIFLEIYSLNKAEIYIVNKNFDMPDLIELIFKLSQFSYVAALKYIKFKYGFRENYLFFES
ncbi:hypothetical protein [Acinetobacter bereziniae]|uniref:hypothetical protein n=1 Tax=Acinetobacter bereziniae TaxID=106648 RepID=UPI00300966F1